MSKKKHKKKDDYKLAQIILITAIIGLIEKLLELTILIVKSWGN